MEPNRPFKTPAKWLAPIRAANLIQLDYYTDTRNFVHIWLPESFDACCMLDKTEDRRFFAEGDVLVTTFEMPHHVRLRGELWPIENGVGMRLAATNLSDTEMPMQQASVCIQFAAAPSFADTALERYFYPSGGKIVHFAPPFQNFEENHAWFYGTSPREEFLHNPVPDLHFIGLESREKNGWPDMDGTRAGSSGATAIPPSHASTPILSWGRLRPAKRFRQMACSI